MEKSYNKIISVYIIFCALIGMLFVSVYYFQRSATKQIDLTMDDTTNLNQYFYGIDPVEVSGEMLTITGWVADKNADLNYVNRKIILVDDAQKAIELKTIAYDRGLTSFFNTGHDYTLGGIMAKCSVKKLNSGKDYHIKYIVTEIDGTQILIDLQTTISV